MLPNTKAAPSPAPVSTAAQHGKKLVIPDELEAYFNREIKGQEVITKTLARAVARSENGFSKQGRPMGGFLFLGPTGVGKTEITLALARFLYKENPEERVGRFDMAEYQRQESLDRLLGGKLGEQGLLGNAIDYIGGLGGGILLFDEIEKANSNLVTVFLGALDAARISMSNGETKDLSRFYMVMTSNLGSADAMRMENTPYASMRRHVMHQAETFFRPEVLARFTEALVFNRLTYETQLAVCRKFLDKEIAHVQRQIGRSVRVREEVFAYLVKRGYSRMLGARPMRSCIEKEIQNCVINWQLEQGHTVQGVVSGNRPLEIRVSDQDDNLTMVEITR